MRHRKSKMRIILIFRVIAVRGRTIARTHAVHFSQAKTLH